MKTTVGLHRWGLSELKVPFVVISHGGWEFCFAPFHWRLFRVRLKSDRLTKFGFYCQVGPFSVEKAPK